MKALKFLASLLVGAFLGTGLFFAPDAGAILKGAGAFIGGDVPTATGFPAGTATAPSIYWTADNDGTGTGWYRSGANRMSLSMNGVGQYDFLSGSVKIVSGNVITWTSGVITAGADTGIARNGAGVVEVNNGTAGTLGDLKLKRLSSSQTTVPTCSSNCGTSPSVVGGDSAGIVTMGASGVPASGWVVTFNGTWAAAPACIVQSALTGMAAGKAPIVVVTTTTTMTVTTNGTAPATSDKYSYICVGVA